MPFIEDTNAQSRFTRAIGVPEFDITDRPAFRDLAAAAFRTENTLGSYMARNQGLPDDVVNNEDFNPFNHFTDVEKLDETFVKHAALADNVEEIDNVRAQQQREIKDRETLADGGAMGFAAMMLAAGFDPINLIPVGGTAYRTYRTGSSILKGGFITAGVASTATAAQESVLHLSQIERTLGESALNVGAATLFGGVLGAAPPAIRKLFTDNPTLEKEVLSSLDPEPKVQAGEDSVGAQRVYEDAIVRGKFSTALIKMTALDPLSRTVTSPNQATRNLAAQMVESPIAFEKGIGTAVETKAKIHDGKYYLAVKGHLESYRAYRGDGGTLNRRDFNEAVAKEVRNPTGDNPHIAASADAWNSKLYEPMKNEFIGAKLLPEDIDVTTAKNYLNRAWSQGKVAANFDQFVSAVAKWLDEVQGQKLDDLDIDTKSLASEIGGRILNSPDGRLPYDYKIGENSSKGSGKVGLRGPLRKRSFNIPDEMVQDFLENDIEVLGGRYLRQTAVDVEMTKAFGDVDLTAQMKEVNDEWLTRIENAKTEKERTSLNKKRERDIADIAGMRDRMRGIFGVADSQNFFVRAGRVARDLNYLRFMGGVTASSFPDAARIVMSEGVVNTFAKGLKPLITNNRAFKIAAEEGKRYGVGIDGLLGGRSEIIADVADFTQGGTAFERGLRSAAHKFGKINLMDQWTSGVKQLHAVTMQNSIIPELIKGNWDRRLGQLGISEADGINIGRQLKKYGEQIDDVWIANSKDWDNQELAMMWGGALRKESDRVIVMPGQEKPLFMSTELGKSIFQFRSFMFSATQRMLIAGIQGQDANFMAGFLGLTTMGMMAYSFKQWDAGREISDDPMTLVTEGIDRSGVLGIFMEANNTIEKVSANNYGLRPMLGIELPAARFASRSTLDSMMGPSFGALFENTIRVAGATADDSEWKDSDTRALRRLLPYQNLMILRQGLDKIEEEL